MKLNAEIGLSVKPSSLMAQSLEKENGNGRNDEIPAERE
jgi:hypothetical protein